MEPAIMALVVMLSLLLVLWLAGYAFKMIEDSLPGNERPHESCLSPLELAEEGLPIGQDLC